VFVVAPGKDGKPRAQMRTVQSGAILGDEVLILDGLSPGEQVAASGAFKLRESVLIAIASNTAAGGTQPEQAPVADAGTRGAN
jgi:membrane fusion protein (multidrug efflux system)